MHWPNSKDKPDKTTYRYKYELVYSQIMSSLVSCLDRSGERSRSCRDGNRGPSIPSRSCRCPVETGIYKIVDTSNIRKKKA